MWGIDDIDLILYCSMDELIDVYNQHSAIDSVFHGHWTANMAIASSDNSRHDASIFLALPAEIRIAILEYVFNEEINSSVFTNHSIPGGIILDEKYRATNRLRPLLVNRQIYEDGKILAYKNTHFIISNLFFHPPDRLALLSGKQISSIRHLAFVADARHFRRLVEWHNYPFDMPNLRLNTLTIVLHRSSFWHYLFDFTSGITRLLRRLHNVRRLEIVRNNALVKGSFKTWYNRLVGLIMKVDHFERYDKIPSCTEQVWWEWSYDEVAQKIVLEARPARDYMGEEAYLVALRPLMEELRVSVENEEWNPDPRSRIS